MYKHVYLLLAIPLCFHSPTLATARVDGSSRAAGLEQDCRYIVRLAGASPDSAPLPTPLRASQLPYEGYFLHSFTASLRSFTPVQEPFTASLEALHSGQGTIQSSQGTLQHWEGVEACSPRSSAPASSSSPFSRGVQASPLLFGHLSANLVQQDMMMAGMADLGTEAPFVDTSGAAAHQQPCRTAPGPVSVDVCNDVSAALDLYYSHNKTAGSEYASTFVYPA